MNLAVDVCQLVDFFQQLGVESLQDAPLGVVSRGHGFQLAASRFATRLQSRILFFEDLPTDQKSIKSLFPRLVDSLRQPHPSINFLLLALPTNQQCQSQRAKIEPDRIQPWLDHPCFIFLDIIS